MSKLAELTDELALLLKDEDLTDEKLRQASETLLPQLHDELIRVLFRNGPQLPT